MQEWYLGWEKVSCLERCPQFRVSLQQLSSEETRVLRGVVSNEGGHRQIALSVGMRSGFVATESGNHCRRQSHDQGLFCRALRVR